MAGLTRSVATLEESFKAAENEKHSIMQDLQAVRDLCARLEATKDNLQRQLTVKTLELEKVTFMALLSQMIWHYLVNLFRLCHDRAFQVLKYFQFLASIGVITVVKHN